jgi:hypothetical protein
VFTTITLIQDIRNSTTVYTCPPRVTFLICFYHWHAILNKNFPNFLGYGILVHPTIFLYAVSRLTVSHLFTNCPLHFRVSYILVHAHTIQRYKIKFISIRYTSPILKLLNKDTKLNLLDLQNDKLRSQFCTVVKTHTVVLCYDTVASCRYVTCRQNILPRSLFSVFLRNVNTRLPH